MFFFSFPLSHFLFFPASKGIVSLALPFFNYKSLPKTSKKLDIVYFENAVRFLLSQPMVEKGEFFSFLIFLFYYFFFIIFLSIYLNYHFIYSFLENSGCNWSLSRRNLCPRYGRRGSLPPFSSPPSLRLYLSTLLIFFFSSQRGLSLE